MTFQEQDYEWRDHDAYALAKFEVVKRWLPPAPCRIAPCRILDVGCGNGYFSAELARRGYYVTALDPNKKACAMIAQRKKTFGLKNLEIVQENFFAFKEKKYDVILTMDVLEHVNDEKRFVKQVRSLLKDDGRWIVTVPALQQLYGRFDELLGHYRRYTKRTLRNAVRSHFCISRVRYFGFSFIPLALFYSKVVKDTYPVQQVSSGIVGAAMKLICSIEQRIPMPIGTSLIAVARPLKR